MKTTRAKNIGERTKHLEMVRLRPPLRAERPGERGDLSRAWPMAWKHVTPSGTFRFAQPAWAGGPP